MRKAANQPAHRQVLSADTHYPRRGRRGGMAVGRALATSTEKADRDLARSILAFVQEMAPADPTAAPRTQTQLKPEPKPIDIEPRR